MIIQTTKDEMGILMLRDITKIHIMNILATGLTYLGIVSNFKDFVGNCSFFLLWYEALLTTITHCGGRLESSFSAKYISQ
jgi:hypothetical protein